MEDQLRMDCRSQDRRNRTNLGQKKIKKRKSKEKCRTVQEINQD